MLLRLRTDLLRFLKRAYRRSLGWRAQYGEDIVISELLKKIKVDNPGFFVDIGAHHPSIFSNTYVLYKRGWNGINIEADPELLKNFFNSRQRDINLNIGIGSSPGRLPFFRFDATTLSTFSESQAEIYKRDGHKLIEILDIPICTMQEVFERHCNQISIDFLSIDIEGYEMEALKGNDWDKYRPKLISCETINDKDRIDEFLSKMFYEKYFLFQQLFCSKRFFTPKSSKILKCSIV